MKSIIIFLVLFFCQSKEQNIVLKQVDQASLIECSTDKKVSKNGQNSIIKDQLNTKTYNKTAKTLAIHLHDNKGQVIASTDRMIPEEWTFAPLGDNNTVLQIYPASESAIAMIKFLKSQNKFLKETKTIKKECASFQYDIAPSSNKIVFCFNQYSNRSDIVIYNNKGDSLKAFSTLEGKVASIKCTDHLIYLGKKDFTNKTIYFEAYNYTGKRVYKWNLNDYGGEYHIQESSDNKDGYVGISTRNAIHLYKKNDLSFIRNIKSNDPDSFISSFLIQQDGTIIGATINKVFIDSENKGRIEKNIQSEVRPVIFRKAERVLLKTRKDKKIEYNEISY